MRAPRRGERFIRRAYRALLRVYPASFREEYGQDVEETFVDGYRAAQGGNLTRAKYLAGALADVVANGWRERMTPQPRTGTLYWQDLRYAFRLLRRSPVFTLLTLIVLSGGLGLSIFTFSFLHTAMLKPLPFGDGERIVRIAQETTAGTSGLDAADVAAMRPAIQTLAELGAYTTRDLVLGDDGHERVIDATATEWNIFELTRTPPALGRGFRADDQAPGAEPVVVLSHWAWERIFGADSTVVDRVVDLSGTRARVIGVMPRGYGFPVAAEAWVPLPPEVHAPSAPGAHHVTLYARLTPETTVEQAETELNVLLDRARRTRPVVTDSLVAWSGRVAVRSFPMAQIGDEGPFIFTILNVIAALILPLACINVMNLLLARANERARETAVRLALGASRARLVVQSMWESVLLSPPVTRPQPARDLRSAAPERRF